MLTNIAMKLIGFYLNTLANIFPKVAARQGFFLFCYPVRTAMNGHQKSFLASADKFPVPYKDQTLQGYRWGQGPKKVLFVHGWQSHSYRWKPYIDAWSLDDYTLYAFDAPGHGLSSGNSFTVPDYTHALLNVKEIIGDVDIMIAHSVGCFAVLYGMHLQSDLRLKKLILLAPPGQASDFLNHFRNLLGLNPKMVNLIIRTLEHRFNLPLSYFSTITFAEAIQVPGLIVHDLHDQDTPYQNAVAIQKKWPQGHLITTSSYGHRLKSPKVVNAVLAYVQRDTIQSI